MSAEEIVHYVDNLSDEELGICLEAICRRRAHNQSPHEDAAGTGAGDDPWGFLVPLDEMRAHLCNEDLDRLPTTETLDATLYGSAIR